ncbi:MAG: nuclease, partial [Deltaproteobacteria bacterium]|nr:nuclease [Deltaproteobacteria bacterium]
SSTAEIDYLAVVDGRIHPAEVKSGAAGRLKSLHLFLRRYHNASQGIVFSMRSYAELPEHKLVFIPLYFAFSATGGRAEL